MEATHLPHCGKHVYIINRQFLHSSHPYRKKKAPFNGFVENGPAPIPLTGKEVYNRVKGMGYSSNMRRLVSMTDLKLIGLKSHDCHVMMQVFLPIAIRGILPKHVRLAITRLCSFFNTICNKVLDPDRLDALQNEVVITLCQFGDSIGRVCWMCPQSTVMESHSSSEEVTKYIVHAMVGCVDVNASIMFAPIFQE